MILRTKVICFVAGHKVSWIYYHPTSCVKRAFCTRCGAELKGFPYDYPRQPEHEGFESSCLESARCRRCGERRGYEVHPWGQFDYESLTSCRKVRFCVTCRAQDHYTLLEHSYDEGREMAAEPCPKLLKTCLRCGHQEPETIHMWGAWDSWGERRCQRCQVRDYSEDYDERHDWTGYTDHVLRTMRGGF